MAVKLTVASLAVLGKDFAIFIVSSLFSLQEFSLLLLGGIFLNIRVLRKLRFSKSSISSKRLLISLSWLAAFPLCYFPAQLI